MSAPRDAVGTELQESRVEAAAKLERIAWVGTLVAGWIALVGVIELVTGSLMDDRRFALAMLGCAALGAVGSFSTRRLASRLRRDERIVEASRGRIAGSVAAVAAALAVGAALGYLVGGWMLAVVIPTLTVMLVGTGIVLGVRRRKADRAQQL